MTGRGDREASFGTAGDGDVTNHGLTVNYNNSGRITVSTDRTGRATTTTYGPNDLTTRTSTTGYGPVTYIYNADRRMTSASGPTGTTSFTYDSSDRRYLPERAWPELRL